MPWADEVKAILECFYGGQGIGRAIVKVISGEVNPSGHMPVSVPAFREQIISDENFAEQTEQVTYREGMFMGYRGLQSAAWSRRKSQIVRKQFCVEKLKIRATEKGLRSFSSM